MATTTAGLVGIAVILMVGVAARIDAAAASDRVVALHLTDFARVSRDDLIEAKQLATEVYRKAGVSVVWTDGAAATAQPDGAFHVDVLLLSKEMAAKKCQSDGVDEQVFGVASRPTRRAYIFYNRMLDHARRRGSNVALLLGALIAHEVGHVLLPALSHTRSGLMRADWEGNFVRMPTFTHAQGTTMRNLLTAASEN